MITTTLSNGSWTARAGTAVSVALAQVRALANVLDAWLTTYRKTADDTREIADMSDRELRDIGLPPRGRAPSQASWVADYR